MDESSHYSRIEYVRKAIENNVYWCDTVCRAHGIPGEIHDGFWINFHKTLPYYSNLITIGDEKSADVQRSALESLIKADIAPSWTVKDSWACLDLTELGFDLLFEASWICRSPQQDMPQASTNSIAWSRIDDVAGLAEWESAWRSEDANTEAVSQPRMFPSGMLADSNIAFLAGRLNGIVVAVAVANRTKDVVGLSNVFGHEIDIESCWSGCVRAVQNFFPDLRIVGYERGKDLNSAIRAGFNELHPLYVWVWSDA